MMIKSIYLLYSKGAFENLPSTPEALKQHIKQATYQSICWKKALRDSRSWDRTEKKHLANWEGKKVILVGNLYGLLCLKHLKHVSIESGPLPGGSL